MINGEDKMDDKKRPGGLTALAVINFIFAGFSFFGLIGIATMSTMSKIPMDGMTEAQKTQFAAFQNMGQSVFIFIILSSLVSFILLLISGIGYLRLKKVLGRIVGNVYGIIGIIGVIVNVAMYPKELGGGFGISSIIGIIYPLLTLILLNSTFKDDFVN